MVREFDVLVIGTGSAATTVATTCREAGKSVAIVDSRPYGGTCVLRGCDPKKVLVGAAELVDWARRTKHKGLGGTASQIDWPQLIAFKRTFTEPVPAAREELFRNAGVDTLHGRARFIAHDCVRVDGDDYRAKHIVVAAGARPATLAIDGEHLLKTSEDFLAFDHLPESLIFVGGGYIAFEFAHIANRAGARVTILHRGKRALERFDAELVDKLVDHTRKIGIDVHLSAEVNRIDASDRNGLEVHTKAGTFSAEAAIHAAGRVPDLEDLDLGAAGVQASRRGVEVNEYLQSVSNPAVYAAGDAAASGAPLTPVAGYHGRVASANIVNGNHQKVEYNGMAGAVFTLPPLASVGFTEEEASAQGLKFRVEHGDTTGWYSSRRVAEECSAYKTLIEEDSGRLLGAHLLGTGSDEVINVFALAIRNGIPAAGVKEVLYAYPTHGSNIRYML